MELVLNILKWIAIVFLAGVVGQFGKSLTLKLLHLRGRRATGDLDRAAPDPSVRAARDEADPEPSARELAETWRAQQKAQKKSSRARLKAAKDAEEAEKKRIKAQLKAAKKAPPESNQH
jgi:hypothetical protein